MDLYTVVGNLQMLGFFDIILPFALFFAITYAILIQFGIFKKGDGKKGLKDNTIPAVIAVCVAFFAVAYTPYGMAFGPYLAEMFGKAGTVMATILIVIILLGLSGIEFGDDGTLPGLKDSNKYIITTMLLVAVIIYFTTGSFGAGFNLSNLFAGFNGETVATLFLLGLVGLVIYYVVKTDKKE
jgi:hypothetical protein